MLLVAVICMMVASSVQATDTTLYFFSQAGDNPVDVAFDAHFVLENADGVVAEGESDSVDVSVDPGKYTLSVEQEDKSLAGSVEIEVPEKIEQMVFLLNDDGLTYLEGIHVCDGEKEKGACTCDESCICKVYEGNCTRNVCRCNSAAKPIEEPTATPAAQNFMPYDYSPYSPYSGGSWYPGGRWSTLGMLGAIGAAIAIALADDDNPQPVSDGAKSALIK